MSTDYPFTVPETRLADALGLPRKAIKDVRTDSLEQGADWDYCKLEKNHGAVVFSAVGIERTLVALGIEPEKIALLLPPSSGGAPRPALAPPSPAPDSPPNDPPRGEPTASLDLTAPAEVAVTVARIYPVNRRIIGGTIATETVRVRVRSSEKLRVGMVLRCAHVEGDLYELAERLTRWTGRP